MVGGVFALVLLANLNNTREEGVVAETMTENVAETSIPEGVPNVPMYPDSVLEGAQNNDSDTERNITLSLSTPDSVSDVIKWYRGALSSDGWAVVGDKNVGGYVLLEGEKEEVKTFVQAANRSDLGQTIITQRIRVR